MKIKTSELIGPALDWAVAKCEGTAHILFDCTGRQYCYYSTDWSDGGPIIEREGLDLTPGETQWFCHGSLSAPQFGPTPLIAAMRCYVASKLGDTVDVPEYLA